MVLIIFHQILTKHSTHFRWRFEALKSRCLIIDREILLEKHKIPYESRLKNIQELVRKYFKDGENEEPDIDNYNTPLELSDASININNSLMNATMADVSMVPTKHVETIQEVEAPECMASTSNLPVNNIESDIAGKTENKENTNVENSLANELSCFSQPSTPAQPQFRKVNVSTERMKVLREMSEEIVNKTTDNIIPTPTYQRVEQNPSKPKFTIRHISFKKNTK